MKTIKKNQILMFSDGSVVNSKTYIKVSNKVKILTKDHKTFILNKKNKHLEHHSRDLDDFKSKFLIPKSFLNYP